MIADHEDENKEEEESEVIKPKARNELCKSASLAI